LWCVVFFLFLFFCVVLFSVYTRKVLSSRCRIERSADIFVVLSWYQSWTCILVIWNWNTIEELATKANTLKEQQNGIQWDKQMRMLCLCSCYAMHTVIACHLLSFFLFLLALSPVVLWLLK
jgi:hypothetical protein